MASPSNQTAPNGRSHDHTQISRGELIHKFLESSESANLAPSCLSESREQHSEDGGELGVGVDRNQHASLSGSGITDIASEHQWTFLGSEHHGEIQREVAVGSVTGSDGSTRRRPYHVRRPTSAKSRELDLVLVPDQDPTLENYMVVGSLTKRQLSVSSSIVIDEAGHLDGLPLHKLPCKICGAEIGLALDGREFVPCECAFHVCRPCYEYVRLYEGNRCPQCHYRYHRQKGSPPVPGDPPEAQLEYMEEQDEILRLQAEQTDRASMPAAGQVPNPGQAEVQQRREGNHASADSQPDSHAVEGQPGAASHHDDDHPSIEHKGTAEHEGVPAPDHSGEEFPASYSPEDLAVVTGPGADMHGKAFDCHSASGISYSAGPESGAMALQVMDPKKGMSEYGYGSIVWVGHRSKGSSAASCRDGDGSNGDNGVPPDDPPPLTVDDTRRPLSRKVPIPASLLNPYRFMVLVRFVVMVAFFIFRITNPNNDAYPLWLASVFCEIWFGISWIFDTLPKWSPITRETYLHRLALRYEPEGQPSLLPNVDIFVSTADAEKEPPLVTANVILSILAMDYPVDKIACYLSDDGAAMLTFEALTETANFARAWVPFCKKYDIEPRAPEMYFTLRVDYLKGQVQPDFVRERRHMKREYDEFKVRINAMVAKSQEVPREGWQMPDGTPWPGNKRNDHVGMIQVFLQPDGDTTDINGDPLPRLVYVSREKRPNHDHNKKAGAMNALMRASALITNAPYVLNLDCDHYVNNSQALREAVCFLIDPQTGGQVCFVQFPQRFDGVDKNDRYANHNTVFYDVNMKGLDGQQGPMYVGTGCVFRRQAIYGFDPPAKSKGKDRSCCCPTWFGGNHRNEQSRQDAARRSQSVTPNDDVEEIDMTRLEEERQLMPGKEHVQRFGMCHNLIMTTFDTTGGCLAAEDPHEVLSDVILVISCGYEDGTEWGITCGWMYGSVTEDIVTGYVMHTRGWRSVYCMPRRPAFKGSAPINMTDRLGQVLRWATGSVEIFFSGHNPMWGACCSRLKMLQRVGYVNTSIYPFTSVALVIYCFLPAISLFTNQFIIRQITNWAVLYFLALFLSIFATALLELRWSGISLEEWWRNEQFWVIGGTSAHFAAVLQGLLKVFAGVDVHFTLTAKAPEGEDEMAELYTVRWTWLFLMPMVIIFVNCFAILMGVARVFNENEDTELGQLVGQVFFSAWVLLHMYPFSKGLMGRSQKTPTILIVWAMLVAIVLSLLFADMGMD